MSEATGRKSEDSLPNPGELSGWGWMPFRFLYFQFYILCRRQQETSPGIENTRLLAWNATGFLIGLPVGAFLFLIDHFIPFRTTLGAAWQAAHLPGSEKHAQTYAFLALLFIATAMVHTCIFHNKHSWIRHKFEAYDRSPHTIAPGVLAAPAWGILACLSLLSIQTPIRANLYVWSFLVIIEIIFRIWWNTWLHKNKT